MKNYSNNIYHFIEDYNCKRKDYYFSRDTLKFWGENIGNMRILKQTTIIKDYRDVDHNCYILSKIGKDYNGKKVRKYDYFDIETLERILPKS